MLFAIKINVCYQHLGAFGSSFFLASSSSCLDPIAASEWGETSKLSTLSDEREMLETELFMLFTRYRKNCRMCLFQTKSLLSSERRSISYLDGENSSWRFEWKTENLKAFQWKFLSKWFQNEKAMSLSFNWLLLSTLWGIRFSRQYQMDKKIYFLDWANIPINFSDFIWR